MKEKKIVTLNFRVAPTTGAMLKELATDAGVSKTVYIESFVRATFKAKWPEKARAFETALERLYREVKTGA